MRIDTAVEVAKWQSVLHKINQHETVDHVGII